MNLRRLPKPCLAVALAACVAALGLLAGCGDDDETTTTAVTATETVPTDSTPGSTTATDTAPAPAPTPTKPGGSKKVAIPDLAGSQVSEAQARLDKLGLSGRAETLTGNRTEIKPDWDVCETHPAAGKRLVPGSPITLITAKPGGC